MGSTFTVALYGDDRVKMEAAADAALDEVRRLDELLSNYKPDSEWSLVNKRAAARPERVSPELFRLLSDCWEYSRQSEGAFDITVGPLMKVWGFYKGSGHLPHRPEIQAALTKVGYRHMHLDAGAQTVWFDRPGMEMDPGGIGKGYAVDRGIAILQKAGFSHAMVNAGGDTRIIGDRLGKPWIVGIRDPDDKNKIVVRLPITDAAMSTSGDYERFFDEGGVRYHHILDPKTGKSPHKVRSVTIIGPYATRTDALTKSVFVMGAKEGIDFINTLPDVDAVAITPDKKVWYSKGLAPPDKDTR